MGKKVLKVTPMLQGNLHITARLLQEAAHVFTQNNLLMEKVLRDGKNDPMYKIRASQAKTMRRLAKYWKEVHKRTQLVP